MKKTLLALLFLLVQPALADEKALTKCRQIDDIAERAFCYDEFVDTRLLMEPRDSVETSASPERAVSKALPDAQSLFGANDAEAKRIVETTLAIEQIDQIEAIAIDVRESANRKLTVTLDNGQIWRQLDNKPMLLESGDPVIIRKASLSSFLMEKKSGSRSIRVKRTN